MAKRSDRVAWGLSVLLALVLLGSGVVLGADYFRRLPEQRWGVLLLPPHDWGFIRQKVYQVSGTPRVGAIESYKCGPFEIWHRHH